MKKLIFFCVALITFSLQGLAQQDDVAACYNAYQGQKTIGYNALAMAIDNGYFVCGYAFGRYNKISATNQSMNECETKRLDPALKVDGVRKIMTHCRIFKFDIIEEKPK